MVREDLRHAFLCVSGPKTYKNACLRLSPPYFLILKPISLKIVFFFSNQNMVRKDLNNVFFNVLGPETHKTHVLGIPYLLLIKSIYLQNLFL